MTHDIYPALVGAFGPINLHDIAIFVSPFLTMALLAGITWVRRQIAKDVAATRDAIVAEFKAIRIDLKGVTVDVSKHASLLHEHGERLAWLEGKSGEPLGSRALPRT